MKDRNATIYEMRKDGYTLEAIGKRYGIGKERVRQICIRQERLEYHNSFKNRNGTRLTVDHIKHEIFVLGSFDDGRTLRKLDSLTDAQRETIKERSLYLEEYIKIISE